MGLSVSGRQMVNQARALCSAETLDQANSFVTDTELLVVLNAELAEIDDTIKENQDENYQRSVWPITTAAGIDTYPLPVDGYKITSVDIQWTNDVRRSVHRFTEAERNRYRNMIATSWLAFCRVYFNVAGSNIQFIPTPASAVTIYVNYDPSFTPLTDLDSGVYDSQNGWHMAAVFGVAAYIAQKDKDDDKALWCGNQKERQLARVRSLAASRIEGEPPRVQRVRHHRYDEDD